MRTQTPCYKLVRTHKHSPGELWILLPCVRIGSVNFPSTFDKHAQRSRHESICRRLTTATDRLPNCELGDARTKANHHPGFLSGERFVALLIASGGLSHDFGKHRSQPRKRRLSAGTSKESSPWHWSQQRQTKWTRKEALML